MKKKKGFTLIELLATLVILAFILVIAVPRIVNVIDNSKLGTITSSAKVVLDSAEKKQSENQVLENPSNINCENVSKLNDTDYNSCDLTFNNHIPYIVLVGSGKLEGYKCEGTKDDLNCRKVVNISLTIDLDGGTGNNQAGSYERNTALELVSPSKEGYTFTGWKIVSGDGSINNNVLTLGIKDIKIKALYQLNEQKLNIDLDGGTGNNQAGSYTVGSNVTLIVPTKEDYDFSGWELISGNSILSGNSITIGSEETTIKATWIKKVTLTLNLDGGTITSNASGVYSRNTAVTLGTPTKTGYDFSKWEVTIGNSTLNGNKLIIGTTDTTVKAVWIKKVTLTLNLDGGTNTNNASGVYSRNTTITLGTPTKTGYDFSKWQITAGDSVLSGNKLTIGTTDTTVKAVYAAKKYTVTYNANGGTVSGTSKSVTYNAKYGTLPTPQRAGYSFLGWYTAKTGGSKITETTIVKITSNQTIYAQWKETLITYEDLSKNYKCKNSSAGATPYIEYSGNCTLLNDGSGNWRIKFTTSGTVKFNTSMSVDIFVVGGGAGGNGGGGGGGYTKTYKKITLEPKSYTVVIGAGGAAANNGKKSYFGNETLYFANGGSTGAGTGGNGGSGGGGQASYDAGYNGGGDGGSYGNDGGWGSSSMYVDGKSGGKGQGTTTCEFGEGTLSGCTRGDDFAYSGGGAGANHCYYNSTHGNLCNSGGVGGGATEGNGTANTGGGGAGAGGSGIVIIRNKR